MAGIRTATRFAVDLPAQLALGPTEVACRIRNMSLGGVCVTVPALTIGVCVALSFDASLDLPRFSSECKVRWSDLELSGLQFEGLRASDVATLAQLIRRIAFAPAS